MRQIELTEDVERRFWQKVEKLGTEAGCWIWMAATTPDGYGLLGVGLSLVYAHRLAWMIANGGESPSKFVLHSCDTPSCVNPAHLWVGSNKQNMQDASKKRRCGPQRSPECLPRGEGHARSKLTEEAVRIIRNAQALGLADRRLLARKFNVTTATVGYVLRGVIWKHVA